MEQVERSIRSATAVTTTPDYGCNGPNLCLSLTMPPDSLEYKANGNCEVTEYSWFQDTMTANGRLVRSWKNKDGSNCNGSSDLFDTDPKNGISVEKVAGVNVFTVTPASNGPANVVVALKLTQGVTIKKTPDNRSQVPFITTISLREYAK